MKTKKLVYYIFPVILLFIFTESCGSGENISLLMKESLDNINYIAKQKLGEPYSVLINSDSTFTLVKKNIKSKFSLKGKNVNYFVFDNINKEIIKFSSIVNGDINWYNKNILEIIDNPEVVKNNKQPQSKFYYDVLTKKNVNPNTIK